MSDIGSNAFRPYRFRIECSEGQEYSTNNYPDFIDHIKRYENNPPQYGIVKSYLYNYHVEKYEQEDMSYAK